MSAPPVPYWWTCIECGDWNSPYVAPTRCGGCNGDRGEDSGSRQVQLGYSYLASNQATTPKVKFGASRPPSRVPSRATSRAPQGLTARDHLSQSSSTRTPLTSLTIPAKLAKRTTQNDQRGSPVASDTSKLPPQITKDDSAVPTISQGSSYEVGLNVPVSPDVQKTQINDMDIQLAKGIFAKENAKETGAATADNVVLEKTELDFAPKPGVSHKLNRPTQPTALSPSHQPPEYEEKTNIGSEDEFVRVETPLETQRNTPSFLDSNPLRQLGNEHVSAGLSRSSSVVSLSDSTFSSMFSGSSQSSIGDSQNHTEKIAKLIFEDDILQPLCFAAVDTMPLERFERQLRRSLKLFAVDLSKEAISDRERKAAKFVRVRARNTAHLVCDELDAASKIRKKKQSAGPRVWEETDYSDCSNDEDSTPDIRELELFIRGSRALKDLRMTLGLFVQKAANNFREDEELWRKESLSELPFHGENSEFTYNNPVCIPKGNSKSRGKLRWLSKIKNHLLYYPKLEKGMKRMQWKCVSEFQTCSIQVFHANCSQSCGTSLYDDYEELETGAAKRLRKLLRKRAHIRQHMGLTKTVYMNVRQHTVPLLSKLSTQVRWLFTKIPAHAKSDLPTFEMRSESSESTSTLPQSATREELFLLLCVNNNMGASQTGLKQPPVHSIDSDRQLFSLLRDTYRSLRHRWWSFISLWSLQHIYFVHFEIYGDGHIDIRQLNPIPPLDEYKYEHWKIRPPIGSNTLKHFMQYPNCAPIIRDCFNKMPKKIDKPLTASPNWAARPGWGLHFVEGWNAKKLLSTYLTFLFAGTLLAVLCRALGYSIQDAFAIASFFLTIFAGGVATLQVLVNME